ncbi:conserved hypothetical protein [Neospora caninum Liverpool]|uniref:ER membrane protein complex subunit 7 beta-sandwich domain-containing protein n=1 Tax=Neospora caninum (strain Liverpool) TaxID=572307 RepID=F0VE79_NEOCL|nr:conserved hypothetical protein [Neospora caninum Liverpool]CBZ52023.1 conserved hypothetical protein [Neospora caninum Liverpool]CEL65984.1 TPA: hypothetical protein BN1204_018130 [Neospora caninum Liverpool]|eukprot:XP_003882055.1 conserved hypothetical protein [Neospora caninum Liverpool]
MGEQRRLLSGAEGFSGFHRDRKAVQFRKAPAESLSAGEPRGVQQRNLGASLFAARRRSAAARRVLRLVNTSLLVFSTLCAAFAASALSDSSSSSCSPSSFSPLLSGRVTVPPQLLVGLRISVNGDFLSISPSSSGDFALPCLPVGSYVIQPSHPLLVFPSYLLTVSSESGAAKKHASRRVSVYLLGESFRPLTPDSPLPLPLRVAPASGPPAYFVVKPPFSLLFLLQQPLLLVAAACFGLMWCLPKLQQYQEEERQQRLLAHEHQQALRAGQDARPAGSTVARRASPAGSEAANFFAGPTGDAGRLCPDDEDIPAFLKALGALRGERCAQRR